MSDSKIKYEPNSTTTVYYLQWSKKHALDL